MKLTKILALVFLMLMVSHAFASTVFKLTLKNLTTRQAFFFAGFNSLRGPILKGDGSSVSWTYTLDDAWAPFGFLSVDGTRYFCKKEGGDYLMLNPRNYLPTDIVTITVSALHDSSLACSCDPEKVCSTALLK